MRSWLLERRRLGWALAGVALTVAVWAFAPGLVPLPRKLTEANSTVVQYADGTAAYVFLSPDEKWRAPADEVDPAYVTALLRLEDKRFSSHHGVDPLAVGRAALSNLAKGHRVSGASTLTMQLVRMLEPRPRTLRSKVIEAVRAYLLERRFSKAQILRAYLERVPFGRNIEGVEAAALAYFGHRANHLSPAEIATLLAVPQDPNDRFPSPQHQKALTRARDEIAGRLALEDALPRGPKGAQVTSGQVLAELRATTAPARLRPFPREAPHAAIWLHGLYPKQERIRTTLEAGAQRLSQKLLLGEKPGLALQGVHNGAVVVVDHATGQVVALAGNLDFWDSTSGGQIVGFDEPRSPGSTLKPFLYALAIDQGLTGPEMRVADVPATFGTYAPRNYDGEYSGLVTMEDALSRSLNLPFISLLQKVGVERFLAVLGHMGAASLNTEPGHYGLSAIVGGVELKPLEIAALYTTLAEGGEYRPLRLLADEPSPHPTQILSPGATYLARRALSLKDRPDFPSRRQFTQLPSGIHWKTGTSFGHRDAWAAGSDATHTAVVWLGNFDNHPSSALVGAEAAGPILFDVLEGLADRSRVAGPDVPPGDLVPVEVCAFSGHLATAACPRKRKALAVKNAVPTAPCPYHVALDVDVHTQLALTPLCRSGHAYERKLFTLLPTAVRRWMGDQLRDAVAPPAFAPGCVQPGGVPQIVSPAPGQVAMLIEAVPLEHQEVPLEAELEGAASALTWFVDGKLVGTAHPEERVWWTPRVGRHEVVVTTDSGAVARRAFEVRRAF
jgi:penicillin-binding protein 1C